VKKHWRDRTSNIALRTSGAEPKGRLADLTNVRLDPYEHTGMFNGTDNGSINYYDQVCQRILRDSWRPSRSLPERRKPDGFRAEAAWRQYQDVRR
jgi:hypothetical protein